MLIKEINGGASLRQYDLILSAFLIFSMSLSTNLTEDKTSAGLEWAKLGITLEIVYSENN